MSGRAVRETVGLLAVVAGRVFVGWEIRQSTIASRAAAYQTLGIAAGQTWNCLEERGIEVT
jgi:hypothetical protein